MTPLLAPFESLPALFQTRMRDSATRPLAFVKRAGSWQGRTGHELAQAVRLLTCGLRAQGIQKGDRVAVIASTRLEWTNADLAILHLGAVTVGLYPSTPDRLLVALLTHSGARLAFVEDAAAARRLAALRAPTLATIIAFDGSPEPDANIKMLSARALEFEGAAESEQNPNKFEADWRALRSDDLATIVYTSGTTGQPKGAMLSHGNLCYVAAAACAAIPNSPDDSSVAFLPMAHTLQRVAIYAGLQARATGAYAESIERLLENLREVRPTVQASVPRIWERAYHQSQRRLAEQPAHRRRLFDWALAVGREAARRKRRHAPLPLELRLRHALADRLVLRRLRRLLFGDRIRFLTSGGAPIAVALLEFFHALGLLIVEGYGLTETAAPVTINRLDAVRFGTVGQALPGVELKIAPDGEVCIRSPGLFRGYYQDEAATRAAYDSDGFFLSGDIGSLDADGFLSITDRKKDLIVTACGHKVAPQALEAAFKEEPLVEACLIHGERRSFLSALLTVDPHEIRIWYRAQGLAPRPEPEAALLAYAAQDATLRDHLEAVLAARNERLLPHERIKRWAIIPERWSEADGSLTPTLKLKRRVLEERHRALLDSFYGE